MIRAFVEKFSRNKIIRRVLPNGSKIHVSPDAALQYLKADFGKDLIALAQEHIQDSSIVWDVGANCGVFAFSSLHAKNIIAFEADPFLCHLLLLSSELNDKKVNVVSAAISNKNSIAQFSIANRGRASNFLTEHEGRSQSGGERYSLSVPTMTLDSMLETFPAPTFIKIDVEGAELNVLQGCTEILEKVKPLIFLEVGEQHQKACRNILEKAGYEIETDNQLDWLCKPK